MRLHSFTKQPFFATDCRDCNESSLRHTHTHAHTHARTHTYRFFIKICFYLFLVCVCVLQMMVIVHDKSVHCYFTTDDRDLQIVLVGKDCYSDEELLATAKVVTTKWIKLEETTSKCVPLFLPDSVTCWCCPPVSARPLFHADAAPLFLLDHCSMLVLPSCSA